jgi:predicted dehydrogenase
VPGLLNIAMIGSRFMGRAHSNAWMSAYPFFGPERLQRRPVMHTICAEDADATRRFAEQWGWTCATTSFHDVLREGEIELVDVCTPNDLHAEQSIAAIEAGKHVACEKPLAHTLQGARQMRDTARRAKRRGIQTFVWFNYRRCPAIAQMDRMVRAGRLGRIYHVRATYLQDWGGPDTPLSWRFNRTRAGSGAHGDLSAHIIDLARFVTGDEILAVEGAIEQTFIKERLMPPSAGKSKSRKKGKSTVDDCMLFLARFRSGAVASFEATRLATGHANRNSIEINGELGSLRFDFERMNELQWFDNTLEGALRGWSRVLCTTPGEHAYVDAYWPPGHGLGYEHTFVSQAADIIRALGKRAPLLPLADFEDAYETQRVLTAAQIAARERCAVTMSEVK